MTDSLPKGLVVNTESINSNIESLGGVDVADIAQLWRVYTTNTNFVDDEAGARLENFFWRIWSSRRIYRAIQGPTLARLFARISDGSPSIRTTPVPSPPKPSVSRRKGVELVTPLISLDSPLTPVPPPRVGTGSRSSSNTNNDKANAPSEAARAPLPPILKKPRADSDDPPKTTRIVIPEPEQTTAPRPAQPPRRESERNAPNQGRKKSVFVATAANSRRKPILPRRKSSRSPSSGTTSTKESPILSPKAGTPLTQGGFQTEAFDLQRPALTSAIDLSSNKPIQSSGSWQDTNSFITPRFSSGPATNKARLASSKGLPSYEPHLEQPSTSSLVDKDFRVKFAEKKIRELGSPSSMDDAEMMPPPPLPQRAHLPQTPSSKKEGGKDDQKEQTSSPRGILSQATRSASTPLATTTTATAPVSTSSKRAQDITPSPSVSSSKSQSQLSTLIEADRRKRTGEQGS